MTTWALVAYAGMGIILSLLVAPSLAVQTLGVHQPASAIPLPNPVSTGDEQPLCLVPIGRIK